MLTIPYKPKFPTQLRLIVCYATIMHLLWGVLLLIDPTAFNVTAINVFSSIGLNLYFTSALFLLIGSLASFAVYWNIYYIPHSICWVLPQQTILSISAVGALQAMILSRFADGVIRSRVFIIADQMPIILIAVLYGIALVQIYSESHIDKS